MGDRNHKNDTEDKGLFSNLAAYATGAGHYPPPHGAYPPPAYPRKYIPHMVTPHKVIRQDRHTVTTHQQATLLLQDIRHQAHQHIHHTVIRPYPPSGYPGPSHSHSGHGSGMGAILAGGTAAAAAAYGAHHLAHGGFFGHHGKFKHGKFGKRWKHHGMFGKHGGKFMKFKKWK